VTNEAREVTISMYRKIKDELEKSKSNKNQIIITTADDDKPDGELHIKDDPIVQQNQFMFIVRKNALIDEWRKMRFNKMDRTKTKKSMDFF
jgi:flavorubredoxin